MQHYDQTRCVTDSELRMSLERCVALGDLRQARPAPTDRRASRGSGQRTQSVRVAGNRRTSSKVNPFAFITI